MVCEPSFEVNPEKDRVILEGMPLEVKRYEYILFNKPKGVTTTKMDRFAERTVMDFLPKELKHLYPVGRLDKDTEGLLLLTNNGKLANSLMHPRFEVDKVYRAEVRGHLKENDKMRLQKGIILEGRRTAPCKIDQVVFGPDKTIFEITLHEGRKRQIRMMLISLGYPVISLKRVEEGPISLGDLPTGKWRKLTEEEITDLRTLGEKEVK